MAGGRENALKDYVMVHERIQEFYDTFPEGSIQSKILDMGTKNFGNKEVEYIVIRASAYRYPDDPRPGIGHAHEVNDGNNYINKTSMIENAETSAWGRALAALGMSVKSGVASKEEVDNAKRREKIPEAQSDEEVKAKASAREKQLAVYRDIKELHDKLGVSDSDKAKKELLEKSGVSKAFRGMTLEQYQQYLAFLKGEVAKITRVLTEDEVTEVTEASAEE